jgi:hypothetical protein
MYKAGDVFNQIAWMAFSKIAKAAGAYLTVGLPLSVAGHGGIFGRRFHSAISRRAEQLRD